MDFEFDDDFLRIPHGFWPPLAAVPLTLPPPPEDDKEDVDVTQTQPMSEVKGSGINPLLIPHILAKVLTYVNMADLVSCRQVCANWKSETRTVLQKLKRIKFNSIDQVKSYIENLKDIDAEDFIHAMYQFGPLTTSGAAYGGLYSTGGFRRIRMGEMMDSQSPYYSPGYKELCQETLRTFFTTFGSRIKVLELDSDFEMPLPDLRQFLSMDTNNLESLSMTLRYTRSNGFFADGVPFYKAKLTTLSLRSDVEMLPIALVRDFLIMAPNLKKITCLPFFSSKKYSTKPPTTGRVDFIRVLFHTIVMAPNPPPLRNLNNLDINLQLTDSELQGLINKSFPLNSITLGICSDVRGPTLAQFLQAGRNLLCRVVLNFHPSCKAASYNRYNVCLSKLSYLCLCHFKGSLAFVKNCPVLKTLIVAKSGNLANTFPLHEIGPHDLQELFVQWDLLEDPDIIGRITRCFPKLKSFSMRKGNDSVLREIYLTMPYLQKLTILEGGFTDEGITGINEIVYKDIAESGSLPLVDAGKLRTNMSIASLSSLRKLRLESSNITDASLFLGIGCCSRMQHLHLECPLLTDYCLWRITKFPYITSLNLVSCPGLSMEWKIKMKNEFKAQDRSVNMEWATVEEVIRESQRRALILPDLQQRFYHYPPHGAGDPQMNGGEVAGEVAPQPPPNDPNIPLPPLDSSDSEDDDVDMYRAAGGVAPFRHAAHQRQIRQARQMRQEEGRGRGRVLLRGRWRNFEMEAFGGDAPRRAPFRAIHEFMVPPGGPARARANVIPPEDGQAGPPHADPALPALIPGAQDINVVPGFPYEIGRRFYEQPHYQRFRPEPFPQVGPSSPSDFPPPIPVDLDFLDVIEM